MTNEEVVWEGIVESKSSRIVKRNNTYCAEVFIGNSIKGGYESAMAEFEQAEIFQIAWLDTRNKSAISLEKATKELSDIKTELYGTKDCLEESSDKVQSLIKEREYLRDRIFQLENLDRK